ncbi:HIT family protein [Mesorhizobium sp. B4-1-4]|uniref:HIT family protein n=1 Tax=Mesorhizobium sp. B4-1-4 TaxID=2589888 RepID=UPI001129ED9D|nr:HIT family protein [Mesorhizobium sp. B4-1-4]UCI31742.1 HIT family protein [Mesorhizobium sp. B4-1-4]
MVHETYSRADVLRLIDNSDERHFLAELETGIVTLSRNRQYFKGYCFFSAKRKARELHDLPSEIRSKHLMEMALVAEAVQLAFGAKKMNVAFFGNAFAHVHWNIIPRYGTDPLPEDSIWTLDRKLIESHFLPEPEFSEVKATLRDVLLKLCERDRIPVSFS